jgi:tetraacyldisaccharide 4'-kinase
MTEAPSFRQLLLPLTPAYRLAVAFREFRLRHGWEPIHRLGFPVISIGNLSTGGAGKTPFAIALARELTARGYAVDVLSRGYGRQSQLPARVDPQGSPDDFGDEPLLIAREAGVPVYVARQRYEAGLVAEADATAAVLAREGARLHILDDAFQHRQLHRDINILILNQDDLHDRLLPAGNLRDPLHAIARADVIAIPVTGPDLEPQLRALRWNGSIWRLHRHMEVPRIDGAAVAFCGIARPAQFFAGLEAAGLRLSARIVFRDHHRYTVRDLDRLQLAAQTAGAAAFITTAKDQTRLAAIPALHRLGLPILTAGLRIEIHDQAAALDWLTRRLNDTAARLSL